MHTYKYFIHVFINFYLNLVSFVLNLFHDKKKRKKVRLITSF